MNAKLSNRPPRNVATHPELVSLRAAPTQVEVATVPTVEVARWVDLDVRSQATVAEAAHTAGGARCFINPGHEMGVCAAHFLQYMSLETMHPADDPSLQVCLHNYFAL